MIKKVFIALTLCLMMVAGMTSCSSVGNTPKDVALAAVKCMQNKDIKGYMDLTNAESSQKDAMAAMLGEKMNQKLDEKKGIASYSVVSEDIDQENKKATVTVKIVYGNGEEENNPIKLVSDGGQWKVSADK